MLYEVITSHMDPIHKSGRGAGGHCFIKDFSAFTEIYEKEVGDQAGINVLHALRDKNIDLMVNSNKDLDLLYGVYGDLVPKPKLKVLITVITSYSIHYTKLYDRSWCFIIY